MIRPFDIQINGYAGVDFCAAELDVPSLHHACQKLLDDGVDSILATIITDDVRAMESKIANLRRIREADDLVSRMIAGIHVEGPFLSSLPGFIGAHAPEHAIAADVEIAKRLLEAGQGLVQLVTLAPECDPGFKTTEYLERHGVVVSAGHCDPSLDQITGCIDHGLTMVTHLGNGCPVKVSRHDNVIQRFLNMRDRLWFTFIPDGIHIPFFVLKNYLDLVGLDRAIMVTDAISAARLGPGEHEISGMKVQVDDSGAARKPGSQNLAGSTVTMAKIRDYLARQLGLGEVQIKQLIDENPRRALGKCKGDSP
jgi:N-acetylglucosamine-6-phosphate deacetylase